MPRVTFMKSKQELEPEQQEQKEKAKRIYLSMPLVRLATIARRARCTREQVATWRDEENWLEQRADFQSSQLDRLFKKVGSPEQSALATLEIANEIQEIIKASIGTLRERMKSTNDKSVADPATIASYASSIQKLSELRERKYKELVKQPAQSKGK